MLFFDPNWLTFLKFLNLPTKICVGMFLFFLSLLIFDGFQIINLNDFRMLSKSIVIIGSLLFGCLTITSLISLGHEHFKNSKKHNLIEQRRKDRIEEQNKNKKEYEDTVLSRLDYLSKEELRYVKDCLKKNEQSFLAYVHHGPVSNLGAKGLIDTPGGKHYQDHYPFFFIDFVWKELLRRKKEFLEK